MLEVVGSGDTTEGQSLVVARGHGERGGEGVR